MKTILTGLFCLAFAGAAFATDKSELDFRIRKLTAKFEEMQQKPDKRIPASTLRKAQGIVLLDRTKAGFLFAFEGGSGVALVKDAKSKRWSPAAFYSANEASLGFQVGGQQSFVVILLMSKEATHLLTDNEFEFGGEARGTAGDSSAGAEATVKSPDRSVLVYDERSGLFGGAAVKGGALTPDEDANAAYYDHFVTPNEILFGHKVKPTAAADELIRRVAKYSAK
ncbi:MAG: lipid-binding SYLF domain-containing protein [Verrucomicrobia bacterium]|nr:lipid-binding SYLF domain-containing protein [Verrucomicrobiota bacterium]